MDAFTFHPSSAKDEAQETVESASSGAASKHLPESSALGRLKQMFPGKIWLNVPQVAACLHLSTGHIYNQHSAGNLPFKMKKDQSGRLRASVLDIADYMERQQLLAHDGKRLARGPRLRWMAPLLRTRSAVINPTTET